MIALNRQSFKFICNLGSLFLYRLLLYQVTSLFSSFHIIANILKYDYFNWRGSSTESLIRNLYVNLFYNTVPSFPVNFEFAFQRLIGNRDCLYIQCEHMIGHVHGNQSVIGLSNISLDMKVLMFIVQVIICNLGN